MSKPIDLLGIYLHLARASQRRRRLHVRDRLFVIAGVNAVRIGLDRIAAYCRQQVLEHNPQHLIRRWATISEALEESDFLHFLKQLQRRYPQERAERMIDSLGIEMGRERDAYFSDEEYAAALLDLTPDRLDQLFGAE